MKAAVLFTGTGPILILTSYESLTDPKLIENLKIKGIKKFLAYELPLEQVKEKYGSHYEAVLNDVKQTNDLRVLDYNGHNVFHNFSFSQLGAAVKYEPE
jgi:hypothetical protein